MAGIDDGILVKRFVEQDRDAQDLGVAGAGSDQFGRGMRNDGGRGFVVLREGALGTDQHKKPEKSSGCNGWCFHGYFEGCGCYATDARPPNANDGGLLR